MAEKVTIPESFDVKSIISVLNINCSNISTEVPTIISSGTVLLNVNTYDSSEYFTES